MSKIRKFEREVRKLNNLFGQELGRTQHGDPLYAWFWSETLIRPKRVYSRSNEGFCLTYKPVSHILQGPPFIGTMRIYKMEPVYVREKLCQHLRDSSILCVWIHGKSFEEWRRQFEDTLEWPKGGEYFPVSGPNTTAHLEQGRIPTEDDTWQVIRWLKSDRQQALDTWMNLYEANEKSRDKRNREMVLADLDNILPAWDNIPGSHAGSIEFMGTVKPDPRIKASDLHLLLPQKGSSCQQL